MLCDLNIMILIDNHTSACVSQEGSKKVYRHSTVDSLEFNNGLMSLYYYEFAKSSLGLLLVSIPYTGSLGGAPLPPRGRS